MIYPRATQASLISLSERDEERFLGANEPSSKAIQKLDGKMPVL